MSRPATLRDHLEALRAKAQRASRAERAFGYRLEGWSHQLVTAFADNADSAVATISTYLEALDPYEHGLEPPFSTPTSGRIRKGKAPFIPWYQRGGLPDGGRPTSEGFVETVGPPWGEGGHEPVGDAAGDSQPLDREVRPDDNGVGNA